MHIKTKIYFSPHFTIPVYASNIFHMWNMFYMPYTYCFLGVGEMLEGDFADKIVKTILFVSKGDKHEQKFVHKCLQTCVYSCFSII